MGYITWDDYQRHQVTLRQSAQARGCDRRQGPPGEGPALLQGLVLCGVCGQRMTVRYHARKDRLIPTYICQRDGIEHAERVCQSILGASIDVAIGTLLLEMLTPLTLEVSLAVQEELQQRLNETDRLRRQQVERARYEADSARERFMQVDPKNRLVADALEADWNDRLRALTEAQENCERQRQADRTGLDQESRGRVLALAADFPKLWSDPKTPERERKRMARLLIEDVTLVKDDTISVFIRFKGGSDRKLTLPPAQPVWATWRTSSGVIAEVDRLLNDHTEAQIAALLNQMGLRSGKGRIFTRGLVKRIRHQYNLRSRFDRLRGAGLLTQEEIADRLGVSRTTVHDWRRSGLLKAHMCNDKSEYLYEPVAENRPLKRQGLKRSDPRRFLQVPSDKTKEVQNEA